MNDENQEKLEEVLASKIQDISEMEAGSKDETTAVENAQKLAAMLNDKYRVDVDYSKTIEVHRDDIEVKTKELDQKAEEFKETKKNNWVTAGLTGASIILPPVIYSILFHKGLKFEETGTMGSSMMKNLMQKLKFSK